MKGLTEDETKIIEELREIKKDMDKLEIRFARIDSLLHNYILKKTVESENGK